MKNPGRLLTSGNGKPAATRRPVAVCFYDAEQLAGIDFSVVTRFCFIVRETLLFSGCKHN
jgi:hypothetical protein